MDGGKALFDEDFGQKVDLTVRIREILQAYADGISIVKELLQNADDAKASTVRFCWDQRQHGTQSIVDPKMAPFQGPALLIFNSGLFTEADFESIQNIGNSMKKTALNKTGRFGIGFNSVYHVTDLPSFVSGRHIVYFDPHAQFLPNINPSNPGKRIDFMANSQVLNFADQFAGFRGAFGCTLTEPFNGTIFRLPLRTAQLAATSRLSASIPDMSLLQQLFCHDSSQMLLFLKSVEYVDWSVWHADAATATLIHSVSLSICKRTPAGFVGSQKQSQTSRNFLSLLESPQKDDVESTDFFEFNTVSNRLDAHKAKALADKAASSNPVSPVKLLPWAGVAARLNFLQPLAGRAYCFLPLPVNTLFPVHINGYFELSSNRRDIWWGQDVAGELKSSWNRVLLEEVVAPSYCSMLQAARPQNGDTDLLQSYYNLWPLQASSEPWLVSLVEIYRRLYTLPCLWTSSKQGAWVTPQQALFLDESDQSNADKLQSLLLRLGLPIVRVSAKHYEQLNQACKSQSQSSSVKFESEPCTRVSGSWLRVFLKQQNKQFAEQARALTSNLSRDDGLFLLSLVMSDLTDYSDMLGIPLLPLASGTFTSFASEPIVYVANSVDFDWLITKNDHNQLASRHLLASNELSSELLHKLQSSECQKTLNLRVLDESAVAVLVPLIFGFDTKSRTPNFVPYDPKWRSTLQSLLNYVSGARNLTLFTKFPIIPVTTVGAADPIALYSISASNFLIEHHELSDDVAATLTLFGFRLIDKSFAFQHSKIYDFVRRVSLPELCNDLHSLLMSKLQPGDDKQTFFASLNWTFTQRRAFRLFFASLFTIMKAQSKKLDSKSISILRLLPFWESYQLSDSTELPFCSILDSHRLPPLEIDHQLLTSDFINCHDVEVQMAEAAGLKRMSAEQFYTDVFLPRLPVIHKVQTALFELTMSKVLKLWSQSWLKDATDIAEKWSQTACIPNKSGDLCRVTSLFDPAVPELSTLLDAETQFPSSLFAEPASLPNLRLLGLRSHMGADGVLDLATLISSWTDQPEKAHMFGQRLLAHVDRNASKYLSTFATSSVTGGSRLMNFFFSNASAAELEQEWWSKLKQLSWLPAKITPSEPALPWTDSLSSTAVSTLIRSHTDEWLVSSSLRLLDGTVRSPELRAALGLDQPIPSWALAQQVVALAAQFDRLQKSTNIVVADEDDAAAETKSQHIKTFNRLKQMLASTIPTLYRLLDAAARSSDADSQSITVELQNKPWLWVGADVGFIGPERLAFKVPVQAQPYLYAVLPDFCAFDKLFGQCGGVRATFNVNDYMHVLLTMATESTEPGPLSASQLELSLAIVNYLSDRASQLNDIVLLPSDNCTLLLAPVLYFNDAPWLSTHGDLLEPGSRFVHPKVSNDVAQRLGARSFRQRMLSKGGQAKSMALVASNSLAGAQAFGQRESITRRLRTILELYPEGPGVLFEMIQNADDAKASEVCIVLDTTSHATSSLLSPAMSDWQGPALCVYNNATFSPRDYQNVARIGQGSKLDRLASTGRFGLGFNAVYHFSDVPSFVSGDSIVFLDPHGIYVPAADGSGAPSESGSSNGGGLKLALGTSVPLDVQFPDQFAPYRMFGFDCRQNFAGTLFRFPLRTTKTAARSEIKREALGISDLKNLLSAFREIAGETLLFLRHVNKITVKIIDTLPGGGAASSVSSNVPLPATIAPRVDRRCVRNLFQVELPIPAHRQRSLWARLPDLDIESKESFYVKLRASPENKLPRVAYSMDISFSEFASDPQVVSALKESQFPLQPPASLSEDGAVELQTVAQSDWNSVVELTVPKICDNLVDTFFIVEMLGGGRAKLMATDDACKHLKLLPYAAVASRLPRSWNMSETKSNVVNVSNVGNLTGRAFCFLPLPLLTGLPVHLNAYFELSANRRDLWWGEDMSGEGQIRTQWNQALLDDVIAPAYAFWLVQSSTLINQLNDFRLVQSQLAKQDSVVVDSAAPKVHSLEQLLTTYYSYFPSGASGNSSSAPFARLISRLFAILSDQPVVYAPMMDEANEEKGMWFVPNQALRLPIVADRIPGLSAETALVQIGELLKSAKCPVATQFPMFVQQQLLEYGGVARAVQTVTPDFLRRWLRQDTSDAATKVPNELFQNALIWNQKARVASIATLLSKPESACFLLRICLSDMGTPQFDYTQLIGVPLLMLANGKVGKFASNSVDSSYFVTNPLEFDLLSQQPKIVNSLVATSGMDADVMKHLVNPALHAATNVQIMTETIMSTLMSRMFPPSWKDKAVVAWRPDPPFASAAVVDALSVQPTMRTIELIGQYLSSDSVTNLSLFESWPLLPLHHAQIDFSHPMPQGSVNGSSPFSLCLLKRNARPVISMDSSKPLPDDVIALLTQCGARPVATSYRLRHNQLGVVSYAATLPGILQVLIDIASANLPEQATEAQLLKSISNMFVVISPSLRRALRAFITRCVSEAIGGVDGDITKHPFNHLKSLVAKLPIFEACTDYVPLDLANVSSGGISTSSAKDDRSKDSIEDESVFVDLLSTARYLAPLEISEKRLLNSAFLKPPTDPNESVLILQKWLGVGRLQPVEFYTQHLFPRLKYLPSDIRDAVMLKVLLDVPMLARSNPLLMTQIMPNLAFLPTACASDSTLFMPSQLYDPTVPELSALLDADTCFPMAQYVAQPKLLGMLRTLGLRTALDARGVVTSIHSIARTAKANSGVSASSNSLQIDMAAVEPAAPPIAAEQKPKSRLLAAMPAATAATSNKDSSVQAELEATSKAVFSLCLQPSSVILPLDLALIRARRLLAYVNSNWANISASLNNPAASNPSESVQSDANQSLNRTMFLSLVRSQPWLPVLSASPEPSLPWPSAVSLATALAPGLLPATVLNVHTGVFPPLASFACPLASPTHTQPASQSSLVSSVLRLLDDRTVLCTELAQAFGWTDALPPAALCKQLLGFQSMLVKQISSKSNTDSKLASSSNAVAVAASPAVTAPRVDANLVAFVSKSVEGIYSLLNSALAASNSDMIGKLVRTLLHQQAWFFDAETFYPTARLAFGFASSTPGGPQSHIDSDLKLDPYLHVIGSKVASEFSTLFNTMQVPAVFKYSDLNAALAMMGKESHIEPFSDAKIALSIQLLQHIAYVAAPAESIRNITSLNLLVPCEDGRLFVASMLTFNDAPWLSSNQLNRESIQFVHASVDAELSTALGVRSLRELLLVNKSLKKDIVCMSANMVRAQLRATLQPHTFLMDLLEVADLAGARKFEVLFDERSYLTQSILNPGLAECQGPSISLYFDAELSFEDVMKLHVGSSAIAQRELDALSRVDQNHVSAPHVPLYHNSFAVRTSHTLFGNGIVQSFNVADVMLMVSGSSFFVFDPAGKCFVEASEDNNSMSSSSDEAGGVGRVYPSSIHSRFPDQFAPFTLLGFDMSRGLIPSGGTIIRLPLRRLVTPNSITSTISDSTVTESVLNGFQMDSHQSLVFLSSLEQVSIRSIRDSQPQPKLLWQSLIKLQQTTREARVFMRDRTDWRSASLSSFFMGFTPIRHVHSVSMTGVDHRTNETNEDVYVVASVLGAGATRDLAFKNAAAYVSKQAPDSSSHSYWSAWTPVGQVAAKVFSNGQSAAAEPGRLFVHGLPFQQDTGLPVHINAFFHLSQARRFEVFDTDALSKPTASAASAAPLPSGQLLQFPFFVEKPRDEAGGSDSHPDSQAETPQEAVPGSSGPALPADPAISISPLKYAVGTDHRAVVEWNHELLHSCVGDACVDLLIQLRDILIENMRPLLYKFWPLRQNAQLPFVHILPSFAHRVAGHVQPLFLNSDGKFVQLSECAFRAPALMASVERVMSPKFVALFSVPPRIADDLVAANVKKVNVFSAAQCRTLIKQKSDLNRYFLNMDADAGKHRILLDVLHFCLSDMQSNKFDELLTLPLLLFANGRIGVFGRDEGVVVTNLQQRLFPSQAAFMLDSKCAAELTTFLSNAQFQSSLHIRHFNAAFVAQHLPQILPSKLRSGEITSWPQYNRQVLDSWPAFAVPFNAEASESHQNSAASSQPVLAEPELNIVPPTPGTLPSPGWLRALWNCGAVDFGDAQHRQLLRLYSLVPLLSGELTSLSKLEPVAATPLGRVLIMSSENQRDAAMALSSIGISVLDNRFFSAVDIEALLSRYGGGYSIYNALVSMIPSLAALQRFGNNVPIDAGRACLEFVADGFRSGRFTGVDDPRQRVSIVNALRTLPIFEFLESPASVAVSTSSVAASSSTSQVLKSLPDGETFYMLAPEIDIPTGFRNFILSTSRFVAYRFSELSRFLGIEQLSESRLFELHLPLAWPQLSEADQTELIQHIQLRWSSIRTPELIEIVREIPFVPVQRANIDLRPRYCCAHQLFDPRNALFAKIFSDDAVFPSDVREPVDWRSTASLDFLALVGMRTRLDATSFVECARKVEQLGRVFFPASAPADIPFAADSISLNSKSDISDAEISRFKSHQRALSLGAELISQLFGQAVSELFTPALCTSISDIAFVPVDCSMLLIQPAGRPFTSAVIQHAQPSAITSLFSHLMPVSASSQSVTHFPVPSPHAWLARYRDVCLRRDRSLVWTVAPVLPSVCEPAEMSLRFLQLSTPPAISLVMSHLQSICSTPLDQWTHEDAPSVVFVDICKYLTSELNSRRLDSKALNALREIPLVPIGNRLVKSSRLFFRLEQDLAPFMFEVPRAFGTFDALLKALGARETAQASDYLLFLRELSEESLNGQNALNINEINAIVRVLTLIAEARDSVSEAVLVPDSEGRLVLATACAFNNAPHMAVRADPNKLKLVSAKLSDRLCRRLGVPPLSAVVEEVLSSDTVPVDDARFDMMRAAFQSSEFAAALVVIANDRLLRDPDRVAASQLHVPSADELHGWLSAYSLRAVQSLHTRLLLQIRSASIQRLDVTRHDASEVRHFVDHRSRIVYVCADAGPPPLCVETFLTHALQMIVERQASSALRWWDHAAVAALLMSGSPSGSFSHFPHLLASLHIVPLDLSALRRGVPGMPVLPVDREFATITPSRRFLDGEVVAIEDRARVMRYAIVVSDSRTTSNEIVGSLGVRVDHRDETVQVSSASVYSFRTNIGTSQRQASSTSTSVLVPFEQAPVAINTASSSSQVNVSSLPSNVSGSELMLTAVTDLLSRANMPLDLDRSALLKTAMEAQRSQSDMKAELEKLRLECSRSKARLEEIAASLLCTVCQTNDVGLSLPCGHQMCAQCERSMRVKKCPFCRETFETTVKWFKPF